MGAWASLTTELGVVQLILLLGGGLGAPALALALVQDHLPDINSKQGL